MSYISIARRTANELLEEAVDHRSDIQKLKDVVEEHIANCTARDLHNRSGKALGEAASRDLDLKCEDSKARLDWLIEDVTLLDVKRLAKALAA